jgi:cytoskeletal protein CcmA (bactofilin family)
MFRKKSSPSIEVSKLSSLIAPGVEIAGDVIISDGLRVDGHVEGDVLCKPGTRGLLVLSEKGSISGAVKVHDAVVNGTIRGDLEVEHFLELQPNARVTGNISYRQLRMDCGATVEGRLERLAEQSGERSADNVVSLPVSQAAT